jgi:hypothetical protein
MHAAMAMSPAQWDEVTAALDGMDAKTAKAFMKLCGYLRRFGSVPSTDRALASILGITVGFLRNRTWPLLEARLELTSDGQRYSIPEITGVRSQRTPEPIVEKSKQHQAAAFARHARARAEVEAHAERIQSDAKAHTNFMRDASEAHAETDANASIDASGASSSAGVNSLSLREGSVEQAIEKVRVLERESSRADENGDVQADAEAHARTHKNHAPTHAKAHAGRTIPIPPVVRPILPDWKPSAETRIRGEAIRKDVDAQVQKFIDFNTGKGNTAADWDALFPRFLEHANEHDARRNPQSSLQIVIPGGKSEPESQSAPKEPDEPIIGTGLEMQWGRVQRSLGKGISRNWLGKSEIIGLEEGELTISLPSRFIRDHVAQNHGSTLVALWQAENPEIERVNFSVVERERRTADG